MKQTHFQAIRKHNNRPVKYGPVGQKKLATFSCDEDELTKVGGELRACFFDFYEVK